MRVMKRSNKNTRQPGDPRSDRRSELSGNQSVKWVTGHEAVGDQATHGNYATGKKKIPLRNDIRIGTWNVRGLNEEGKLHVLDYELDRCNTLIAGLSETHWKESGHKSLEKHTIFFSGNESSSFAGVAIAIPTPWVGSVLGYNPVNERIITMKISASPCALNIIQVYAPTSAATDEEIEDFYYQLEDCINNIPKREILMVIGDFNAKVGITAADVGLRNIIGNYGLGCRNNRGERLIQFAADNSFTIMNTVFKHHPRRLYTWTSPSGEYRNQIDYILIRTRWRSSITNAHTLPGADFMSDHQLLVCDMRIRLRKPIVNKISKRIKVLDKESFTRLLKDKERHWHETNCTERDTNHLWSSTVQLIKDTVRESQPNLGSKKRQHWMTIDTWSKVENRRDMKANGATIQELNNISATIQAACRRDRNAALQKVCEEVERHSQKFETRDLHKKIKLITRQFKPKTWAIEDELGNTITEIKEIVGAWRNYCESLFADGTTNTYAVDNSASEQEPLPLKDEVRAAIKHLKPNKAVGSDEIPIETIKAMGEIGVDILYTICHRVWVSGDWPSDWAHSTFVPLHKKGSTKKCGNYRLISLISHASKIMLHVINTRLQAFLSREIASEQAGFVRGRGTREQLLIMRQIVEKAREFNIPLYVCFVDFRKAFDTVKWWKLWQVLTEMGVPQHLVYLIKRLYEDGTAAVRVDGIDSELLKTQAGVRQGCILSPLLFNIYTEYIMRIVLDDWNKGISVGGRKISNLRYADDTTLLASTKDEIETLLRRLEITALEFGLAINRDKTKMLIVDRANNNQPDVRNIAGCEVVKSYVYLGSTITNTGGCEDEIRRRCAMTRSSVERLTKIWKDRRITRMTKSRLMRCLVFPIFLYGAETWTLRMQDRRKIDALEMWCWRRMLRIPWTAHRTNVSILKELNITERLSSTVQIRILKFFGHITRNEDSMERLVVQGKVEGKRSRGRSPTRWTDTIKSATDHSINDCSHSAKNRSAWRRITKAAIVRKPTGT